MISGCAAVKRVAFSKCEGNILKAVKQEFVVRWIMYALDEVSTSGRGKSAVTASTMFG